MPLPRQPEWTRGTLTPAQRNALTPILSRSLSDLCAHLGREAAEIRSLESSRVRWTAPIALIGFAGPAMVGSLAVGTPFDLLRATHPIPGPSEDDLLDWSREIANLLLGSFKLELMRRGVEIQMGLPTSAIAEAVELRCASGTGITINTEVTSGTTIQLFTDAALAPDVDLACAPLPRQGGPGDVLF